MKMSEIIMLSRGVTYNTFTRVLCYGFKFDFVRLWRDARIYQHSSLHIYRSHYPKITLEHFEHNQLSFNSLPSQDGLQVLEPVTLQNNPLPLSLSATICLPSVHRYPVQSVRLHRYISSYTPYVPQSSYRKHPSRTNLLSLHCSFCLIRVDSDDKHRVVPAEIVLSSIRVRTISIKRTRGNRTD